MESTGLRKGEGEKGRKGEGEKVGNYEIYKLNPMDIIKSHGELNVYNLAFKRKIKPVLHLNANYIT